MSHHGRHRLPAYRLHLHERGIDFYLFYTIIFICYPIQLAKDQGGSLTDGMVHTTLSPVSREFFPVTVK